MIYYFIIFFILKSQSGNSIVMDEFKSYTKIQI